MKFLRLGNFIKEKTKTKTALLILQFWRLNIQDHITSIGLASGEGSVVDGITAECPRQQEIAWLDRKPQRPGQSPAIITPCPCENSLQKNAVPSEDSTSRDLAVSHRAALSQRPQHPMNIWRTNHMGFICSHSYKAKQTKQRQNPQMNLPPGGSKRRVSPSPSMVLEAGACGTLWFRTALP